VLREGVLTFVGLWFFEIHVDLENALKPDATFFV